MKTESIQPPPSTFKPEATRRQALNEITLAAALIAAVCILVNYLVWGATPAFNSLPFRYNLLLGASLGLLRVNTQLPLRLRSALLVAVLYASAVAAFVIFGMSGAGAAFLIATAVIAAIFLGIQAGALVTTVAIFTGVGFTYLYLGTAYTPQLTAAQLTSWAAWAF